MNVSAASVIIHVCPSPTQSLRSCAIFRVASPPPTAPQYTIDFRHTRIFGGYRIMVCNYPHSTSLCGSDNPGSIPGVRRFFFWNVGREEGRKRQRKKERNKQSSHLWPRKEEVQLQVQVQVQGQGQAGHERGRGRDSPMCSQIQFHTMCPIVVIHPTLFMVHFRSALVSWPGSP